MAMDNIKYVSEETLDYVIEKLSKVLQVNNFELEDGSVTPPKLSNDVGIISMGKEQPTDPHVLLWISPSE